MILIKIQVLMNFVKKSSLHKIFSHAIHILFSVYKQISCVYVYVIDRD